MLSILKRDCQYTDGNFCSVPIPAVIGIVFGSAAALLIFILVTSLCVRRRRVRNKRKLAEFELSEEVGRPRKGAMVYQGSARPEEIAFNRDAF